MTKLILLAALIASLLPQCAKAEGWSAFSEDNVCFAGGQTASDVSVYVGFATNHSYIFLLVGHTSWIGWKQREISFSVDDGEEYIGTAEDPDQDGIFRTVIDMEALNQIMGGNRMRISIHGWRGVINLHGSRSAITEAAAKCSTPARFQVIAPRRVSSQSAH